ncbi:MAG: hypothetical protein H6Q91_1673 [Deltaproteobacteria bacterium]|nr:hypothetical protein [Deltaproteobacteria bacterium]
MREWDVVSAKSLGPYRAGIAITRAYDLPPLDTIGRRFLAIPGERRPACGAAAVGPGPVLHERYGSSRRRADA